MSGFMGRSGADTSGERAEFFIALLEILHLCILMPAIYPVFYLVLVEREDSFLLLLFLSGLIIAVPAAAARLIMRYVDRFTPCLILYAAAAAAAYGLAYMISSGGGWTESAAAGYRAATAAECFVIGFTGALVRLRENSRKRAKAALDLTWREHRYAFEKPAYHTLAWFVFFYLLSLSCTCPAGCNIAAVCFVLYAGVTCLHSHLEETERYIGRLDYVKAFPRRRLRAVGGGYVLTYLLLAGASALVPVVLTAGCRMYTDIREWSFQPAIDWVDYTQQPAMEDMAQEMDIFYGFADSVNRDAPAWADSMTKFVFFMALLAAGLIALRAFWRLCLDFRNTREENGDVSVALDTPVPEGVRPLRLFRRRKDLSSREKIRRKYRREILKRRREIPGPSETPSEIESRTDLAGTREGRLMHDEYEKARYG